jgi:hypothetical protein
MSLSEQQSKEDPTDQEERNFGTHQGPTSNNTINEVSNSYKIVPKEKKSSKKMARNCVSQPNIEAGTPTSPTDQKPKQIVRVESQGGIL